MFSWIGAFVGFAAGVMVGVAGMVHVYRDRMKDERLKQVERLDWLLAVRWSSQELTPILEEVEFDPILWRANAMECSDNLLELRARAPPDIDEQTLKLIEQLADEAAKVFTMGKSYAGDTRERYRRQVAETQTTTKALTDRCKTLLAEEHRRSNGGEGFETDQGSASGETDPA